MPGELRYDGEEVVTGSLESIGVSHCPNIRATGLVRHYALPISRCFGDDH